MATLKTSPEANCDRQAHRQNDKATYRGSSYRSAQKYSFIIVWNAMYTAKIQIKPGNILSMWVISLVYPLDL